MAITNPFYPGYFPGEPIVRPYRGGRDIPPSEFDLGGVGEYINQLEFDIGGIPGWFADQITADVKYSLRVSASPRKGFDAEKIRDYGAEEEEELPGATGIKVNLNPVDWVTDPGKQASQMVKDWWESVANWSDLTTKVERDKIWRPLIEGGSSLSGLQSSALGFGGVFATGMTRGGAKPLQLHGLGVMAKEVKRVYRPSKGVLGYETVDVDVYEKAGHRYLDFITYSGSVTDRPVKLLDFQRASLTAVRTELENNITGIATGVGSALDRRLVDTNLFISKAVVADSMASFDRELGSAVGKLSKFASTGLTPDLVEDLESVHELMDRSMLAIGDVRKQYQNYINDALAAGNTAQVASLNKDLQRFNLQIGKYESFLGNVRSTLPSWVDSANLGKSVGAIANSGALAGVLGGLKGELVKPKLFTTGGIEENFASSLINDYILNRRSALNQVLDDPAFGVAGGSRIRAYLYTALRRANAKKVEDITRQIEKKGNIVRLLFWTDGIREKIKIYTPAYHIDKFLKRMHYFGLVINEDTPQVFGVAKVLTKFGIFQNTFQLIGDSGKAFTTIGGRFFEVPLDMFSKLKAGELGTFVVAMDGTVAFANLADGMKLIDFINNGLTDFPIDADNIAAVTAYINRLKGFKTWLLTNQANLGLHVSGGDIVMDAHNIQILERLFKQLALRYANQDLIDITQRYAGLLQKLSSKLSFLQTKAFKYLSKFVAPISYIKTFISETLAGLISQAFAAATAGVGELLAPIIQFVSQYIIQKILDVGEAFIKAAVKLDFESFFEDIGKMWAFMIKIVIYALIAVIPFFMFVGFIVIVLLAAVSPANPTKSSNFNPNQNSSLYVEKIVTVMKLPCNIPPLCPDATSVINPPDGIITNADVNDGLRVSYAITIIALEDTTEVKYKDKVTVNGTTVLLEEEEDLGTMAVGDKRIFGINLTPDLQGPTYEDSIVTNTIEVTGTSATYGTTTTTVARSFTIGSFSTSCPLTGGAISNGSYSSLSEGSSGGGHGSNWYWSGQASTCNYTIPYIIVPDRGICISKELENVYPSGSAAACAPTSGVGGTNNICYKRTLHVHGSPPSVREPLRPRQDYYGYALDVISGGDPTVYLPAIEGVSEWSVGKPFEIFEGARGMGLIATAQSATANYKMYLAHLDAADLRYPDGSADVSVGTPIGKLFTGWAESRRHVHIELIITGVPVKPEDYLCR